MPGSEYSQIPFADEIKALIDALETTMNEAINTLETTMNEAIDTLADLISDLEGYQFTFLFKQWDYIYSDDILKSSDGEASNDDVEFVKVKEITFDPSPARSVNDAQFKIKWQQKNIGAGQADARVYVNGGVVSGYHSTSSETYVPKSYNLDDVNPEDKIQLYIRATIGVAYIKEFRICGEIFPLDYTEPVWED